MEKIYFDKLRITNQYKKIMQLKNLSLHKKSHHKSYSLEDNGYVTEVDRIVEVSKHISPANNKDEFLLFDIDTKKIIEEFDTIENVNIEKYSPQNLILSSFYSKLGTIIKIPKSVTVLTLEGSSYMSDLMGKTIESSKVWDECAYDSQLNFYNQTIQDRIERESSLRKYNTSIIKKLKLDSPISKYVFQIPEIQVDTLRIDHVYLSESDLKLLSGLDKLEHLELAYIYNDSINKLPSNLKFLYIYGSTIEKLADINLKGLKLEALSLMGNTLNNIYGIDKIKNLTVLNFDDNLLRHIDLFDLPKKIEVLSLDRNILENDFFEGKNSGYVNDKITRLALSNNNFIINPWLIYQIIKTFPMLEYLDISGNQADGVPDYILLNDQDNSSISNIKFWLETQDYKYTDSYFEIKNNFNYYDNANTIIIKWEHKSLPSKLILSDIQFRFSSLLELMPTFKLYREGIYCDIVYDDISLIIREEDNAIYLEFYTGNFRVLNDYFYKYFHEVKNFITQNTHHFILPVAIFSKNCAIYERFFKFVFNIDKKILENLILLPNAGDPMLLIRTLRKGNLAVNNNKPGNHYKKLKNIAFIIISGAQSFPYLIDSNNIISNIENDGPKVASKKAFELSFKGMDKANYINAITNPYLGIDQMELAGLLVKNDSRYVRNVFFNPRYFYLDSNKIFRRSSEIEMSKEFVIDPIAEITIKFDTNNQLFLENKD